MPDSLTVGQIARTPLLECTPDTPVREAAARMSEARCSSVVIMERGLPVGIWTERDALELDLADPGALEQPIARVMSAPVKSLDESVTLKEAALRLRMDGVRRYLVTGRDGRPVGLVTQTDVVQSQGVEFFVSLREVGAVMGGHPLVLAGTLPLVEAAARMRETRQDAAVVEGAASHGILTERDIVRLIARGEVAQTVEGAASFPLVTVPARASLYHARRVFMDKRIRHLGVTGEDGRLIGLVTYADLLATVEQGYVRELREALLEQSQKLADSEQQRLLAETVSQSTVEGILVTDPQGSILSANPAFTAMLGYGPEEIIGQTPRLLKSGRHAAAFYEAMWQSLREAGAWRGEVWNRCKDGRLIPLRASISVVRDHAGAVLNYVAVYADLTEQKRAEAEIRASRAALERHAALMEAVIDTLPVNIFVKDAAGRYVVCNSAAATFIGRPRDEVVGRSDAELFPPEAAAGLARDDAAVRVAGSVLSREESLTAADGTRHHLMTYKRMAEVGGEALLVGAAFDISARRAAEDARQEAEARLRTLINATPDIICFKDGEGRWLEANQADLEMFHLEGVDYRGKKDNELAAFTHDVFRDAFLACEATDERTWERGCVSHAEEAIPAPGGNERVMDVIKVPVFGPDGSRQGLVVLGRDITERKRMEDALRQLNETLEHRVREEVAKNLEQERMLIQQSRLAAMGEMIGNIAHQWRQPLNALALTLINIQDSHAFGELTRENLESAVANGQRLIKKMSTTIDDFRNFFRPNKEKQPFSLRHAVDDALAILGAGLKSHDIEVSVEGEIEGEAWGHPNEFAQVLLNVINNAKEAILAQRVAQGRIEIALRREDGMGVVTVRDNGGGIPAPVLPRVFEPYFTTKERGTGIGLYMSKVIIEHNMDGRIEAHNVSDGAEFTVACPLVSAAG